MGNSECFYKGANGFKTTPPSTLSKLSPCQVQLRRRWFRWRWWRCGKGIVQPLPQVSVHQQIHAEEIDQIGERPCRFGFQLQELDQNHRDHGCPNLDPYCICRTAHKTFDVKILFDELEKNFNLPTILVDVRNRR